MYLVPDERVGRESGEDGAEQVDRDPPGTYTADRVLDAGQAVGFPLGDRKPEWGANAADVLGGLLEGDEYARG